MLRSSIKKRKNLKSWICSLISIFVTTVFLQISLIPPVFAANSVWNFDYTGNVQQWTVPSDGTYKLEVWGAQGGSIASPYSSTGGKGGYSCGTITLAHGQIINIYVGGQGSSGNTSGASTGGWNGGAGSWYYASGGGGGTDVRIGGTDFANRVIVAGGGGGSRGSAKGGDGGGSTGLSGGGSTNNGGGQANWNTSIYSSYSNTYYYGASLGLGGAGEEFGNYGGGGAGGGGYQGGRAGGPWTNTSMTNGGGGGGSGYVGGVQNGIILGGNQTFLSPSGVSESGQSGNGYARISEVLPTWDFDYTGNAQQWIVPSNGKYKLEVWGAQGGAYTSTQGGKGGYSYGEVELTAGETVYVYVGGKGNTSTGTNVVQNGGWNGGGNGWYDAGGGGGATDIRTAGQNVLNRIIVAGGGGGTSHTTVGGYGGGASGGGSQPGTQTSGNALGLGQSATSSCVGGGGSGFYGGYTSSGVHGTPGSGGSGYVLTSTSAKPSGYNPSSQYYMTNTNTAAGNQSFLAPTGANETGHSGNGYARITALNPAPIVDTLTSPASGSSYSKQIDKLTITGTVKDDKAGNIELHYRVRRPDNSEAITGTLGNVSVAANTSTNFNYSNAVNLNVNEINAAGTYTVEVWGIDSQGGVGAVKAVSINITLNTAPVINELTLPNGTYSKRTDMMPIVGNLTDDKDGSVQIFYRMKKSSGAIVIGDKSLGSITVKANEATSFIYDGTAGVDLNAVNAIDTSGDYIVEVWAKDSDGGVSAVKSKTITINLNSPPLIDSMVSPNSTDTYTSSSRLPIEGSVVDDTAGTIQIWYRIKKSSSIVISDKQIGTIDVSANVSTGFSFTGALGADITSLTTSGTYTIEVWGVDKDNAARSPYTRNFIVSSNAAPTISALSSPNSTDVYMTSSRLPIEGTVLDDKAGGTIQIWYRIIKTNDNTVAIADTRLGAVILESGKTSGSFSYTGTGGADISTLSGQDSYKIEVWGVDADGAVGSPNSKDIIINLNIAPVINSITNPDNVTTYMNTQRMPIEGNVTDDKNGTIQIWYRIKNSIGVAVIPDTQLGAKIVTANIQAGFSYAGTSGADISTIPATGTYRLEVWGKDSSGAVGEVKAINVLIAANSPPAVSTLTSPNSTSTYMNTNKLTLTGSITDDKPGNVQMYYRIKDNSGTVVITDKLLGSVTIPSTGTTSFNYTGASGLNISTITTSGIYKLEVWGKDSDGASGAPFTQNFNVNVNRPPIITGLTSPNVTNTYLNTNRLTITGTAKDDKAGGSVQIWYRVKNGSDTVISDSTIGSVTIPSADGTQNFSNSGVDLTAITTSGSYTLEVWGVDSDGGVGAVFSRAFTVTAGMNDNVLDIEILNPPATPFDVYYVFKFKKIDPKTPLTSSDKVFQNQATIIPVKSDGTIGTIIQKTLQLKIRDALMNLQ